MEKRRASFAQPGMSVVDIKRQRERERERERERLLNVSWKLLPHW